MHHCIHGSAYRASAWRSELPAAERVVLEAAGRVGAVVTFPESLYSYGPVEVPMTEDLPRDATHGKLGIRADLLRARAESSTPNVSVAASDFYGPRVRMAHAGERLVPALLAGKRVTMIGNLDLPHSFTYIPDLARAMVTASQDPVAVGTGAARSDCSCRHPEADRHGAGRRSRRAGSEAVSTARPGC